MKEEETTNPTVLNEPTDYGRILEIKNSYEI